MIGSALAHLASRPLCINNFILDKFYKMEKVNVADKLSLFKEQWSPKIVGELNGQLVKLVKFTGPFVWHHHDNEDEFFYVVSGRFLIDLEDRTVDLTAGKAFVVPKGVKHRPRAPERTVILMVERAGIVPTGVA